MHPESIGEKMPSSVFNCLFDHMLPHCYTDGWPQNIVTSSSFPTAPKL